MLAKSTNSHSNPESRQLSATVFIEYCHHCDSHLASVKHSQQKYVAHFEQVKKYLEERGIAVKKKPTPEHLFKKSPYCPPNVFYRQNGDIVYFPQIGAFEVFVGQAKVFSKLDTNKWPAPQHLYSILKRKEAEQNKINTPELKISNQVSPSEGEQAEQQTKRAVEQAVKSHRSRWPRLPADRYSLQKRNLLNKSQNRHNMTARTGVHSFNKRTSLNQKPQTDRSQLQSKRQEEPVKGENEGLPSLQNKGKGPKANVYLEPIYPKTNVNFENYQRYRMAYAKKIHEQKLAYEIEKSKKEAQAALKFKEKIIKPRRTHVVINTLRQPLQEPAILIKGTENIPKADEINQPEPQTNSMQNSLQLPKQEREQSQWKMFKQSKENRQTAQNPPKTEQPNNKQENKDDKGTLKEEQRVETDSKGADKVKQTELEASNKKVEGEEAAQKVSNEGPDVKTKPVQRRGSDDRMAEDNHQQAFEDPPENKMDGQQAPIQNRGNQDELKLNQQAQQAVIEGQRQEPNVEARAVHQQNRNQLENKDQNFKEAQKTSIEALKAQKQSEKQNIDEKKSAKQQASELHSAIENPVVPSQKNQKEEKQEIKVEQQQTRNKDLEQNPQLQPQAEPQSNEYEQQQFDQEEALPQEEKEEKPEQ